MQRSRQTGSRRRLQTVTFEESTTAASMADFDLQEVTTGGNSPPQSCGNGNLMPRSKCCTAKTDASDFHAVLNDYVQSVDKMGSIVERVENPSHSDDVRKILPFSVDFLRSPRNQALALLMVFFLVFAVSMYLVFLDTSHRQGRVERFAPLQQ
mmetsp:Transcript_17191/g.34384  ORF Transcript_17191/g.34384 Transcript_17191/m.34384 type:complete len:153 (+) Transcript_17191:29-487(+)